MKKHKAVFTAAAVIFLICFILCLQAPSLARTVNSEVWTGEIHPEKDITGSLIKSNLLTAGGQRILLKKSDQPYEIMVTFESLSDVDIEGTITIVNDEPEWLDVSTADSDITLPAGARTGAMLTATRLDLSYEAPELTATVSAAGSTETTASGTGNDTTGTTEAPAAVTQPVSSVPDTLTFSVTFISGSITISGMFTVSTTDYSIELDDEYADLPNGSIVQCSSWYGKEYPVYIELDGAARLKYSEDGSSPGYFPPMTRYETDDQKTVLYNGGYIIAGEAGTIVLDMSHTGVQGQIGLHTESSDHRLDSEEFPVLMTENGMFFTDGTEKILLTKYELDGITPDITVEYLAKNDELPGDDPEEEPEEYVWEDTIVFTITEDPDGAAVISAYDAPAGTYRIKIQWIYSGRLLYSAETEIYVRYSEWQGGIST